jgi:hypothetical protein
MFVLPENYLLRYSDRRHIHCLHLLKLHSFELADRWTVRTHYSCSWLNHLTLLCVFESLLLVQSHFALKYLIWTFVVMCIPYGILIEGWCISETAETAVNFLWLLSVWIYAAKVGVSGVTPARALTCSLIGTATLECLGTAVLELNLKLVGHILFQFDYLKLKNSGRCAL